MKVEGLLFAFLAAFFAVITTVYWLLSRDPTGSACLGLTFGLSFIIGYYLLFTARRMEARPEDRGDAEIAEGAGEMGFFAPHSWWPIALAFSFFLVGAGLVFGPFLMAIGFGFILVTVTGFVFEYYLGINRSQAQTLSALEAMGEQPTSARKFLGE
jgi:protein-S-isoprenylcysteine O-methyltransferase Ste14